MRKVVMTVTKHNFESDRLTSYFICLLEGYREKPAEIPRKFRARSERGRK